MPKVEIGQVWEMTTDLTGSKEQYIVLGIVGCSYKTLNVQSESVVWMDDDAWFETWGGVTVERLW